MARQYKIRKITSNNKTGDAYGLTVPASVAVPVSHTLFSFENTSTILKQHNIKIVEEINKTFKNIVNEIPIEFYPKIKKEWFALREEIQIIETPLQNSIILTSGCKNLKV